MKTQVRGLGSSNFPLGCLVFFKFIFSPDHVQNVRKLVLHDCKYLTDEALVYLPLLKGSLIYLQISNVVVTDAGLNHVAELRLKIIFKSLVKIFKHIE